MSNISTTYSDLLDEGYSLIVESSPLESGAAWFYASNGNAGEDVAIVLDENQVRTMIRQLQSLVGAPDPAPILVRCPLRAQASPNIALHNWGLRP